MRKNKGQKIIKTLEIIAIIILIISFFVLAYCIYISITEEKNYSKSYDAQKASVEYREDEEKDICDIGTAAGDRQDHSHAISPLRRTGHPGECPAGQ